MITPADSPAAASQYNAVAVQPLDIQAPQADLSGAVSAAMSEALSRQPQAEAVLNSPQGYGDFDVTGGYTGTWGSAPEPDVAGP
jgi:hypothetical protein